MHEVRFTRTLCIFKKTSARGRNSMSISFFERKPITCGMKCFTSNEFFPEDEYYLSQYAKPLVLKK